MGALDNLERKKLERTVEKGEVTDGRTEWSDQKFITSGYLKQQALLAELEKKEQKPA
jgi:hypothetical protein